MSKPMIIYMPRMQFFDNSGNVLSGGKVFIYSPGTTTKMDSYPTSADAAAGTSANPNPIILDSSGRPSNSGSPIDVYVTGAFKMVVAPSTDSDPPTSPIWTEDNITTLGQIWTVTNKTSDYTVQTTDRDNFFTVSASSGAITVTLPAVADAGNGFVLAFKKTDSSTNTVTIQCNASETLDGVNTYNLNSQNDAIYIITDGTGWYTFTPKQTNFKDTNGNIVIQLNGATSAVNYIQVDNAATGNNPEIQAIGTDADIGLNFAGKGTGSFNFLGSSTTAAKITLQEDTTNGTNTVGFKAPSSVSASLDWILPSADATTANQPIVSDASQNLSFSAISLPASTTAGQQIRTGTTASALTAVNAVHWEKMKAFTSSGTFTAPDDCTKAFVQCWGGGGSGGGNTTGTYSGGGGGSGAYACGIIDITPGTAYTITIGDGGTGLPANSSSNGNNGSSTSFASTVIAVGGSGGNVGANGGGSGGAAASCTVPSNGFALDGGTGGTANSTGSQNLGWGAAAPFIGVTPGLGGAFNAGPANTGAGGTGGTNGAGSGAGGSGFCLIYY